jgi:hypothetical protein
LDIVQIKLKIDHVRPIGIGPHGGDDVLLGEGVEALLIGSVFQAFTPSVGMLDDVIAVGLAGDVTNDMFLGLLLRTAHCARAQN